MSRFISNNQVMEMFKNIEELKKDELLDKTEVERKIKITHDKIINELSFLVYSNAKMYSKFPNHEDLVQEGYVGLLKAVRRFDYTRFPNFFIYAEQWIRHSIKRAASKHDVVYNPNKERTIYADAMELDLEEVDEITPEDTFIEQERTQKIAEALDELPERDKDIVERIFGLGNYEDPQTLREVGPAHNLTHERVRQIKNSVISKLKKNQRLNNLQ